MGALLAVCEGARGGGGGGGGGGVKAAAPSSAAPAATGSREFDSKEEEEALSDLVINHLSREDVAVLREAFAAVDKGRKLRVAKLDLIRALRQNRPVRDIINARPVASEATKDGLGVKLNELETEQAKTIHLVEFVRFFDEEKGRLLSTQQKLTPF
jgi:hypothetical protein